MLKYVDYQQELSSLQEVFKEIGLLWQAFLDGILLKSLKSETLGWQNFRMPGKGTFHLQLKYTSDFLFVKFLQVKKALSL